jgi:hypothetical protein
MIATHEYTLTAKHDVIVKPKKRSHLTDNRNQGGITIVVFSALL